MIALPFFRSSTVAGLYKAVETNLARYRSDDFESFIQDSSQFIESKCEIDEERLLEVQCSDDDDNEVNCCIAIHEGLTGVTPYLARDERLWVRLSHVELLHYARARWPIPADDEKAAAHIRRHFFARGSRGLERDNAISRLWWMAELCSKVDSLGMRASLVALLHQSDVRANIIERPSTAQNSELLTALLIELNKSLQADKALFERSRFRALMKWLNIQGGVRLLDALDRLTLQEIVTEGATN